MITNDNLKCSHVICISVLAKICLKSTFLEKWWINHPITHYFCAIFLVLWSSICELWMLFLGPSKAGLSSAIFSILLLCSCKVKQSPTFCPPSSSWFCIVHHQKWKHLQQKKWHVHNSQWNKRKNLTEKLMHTYTSI